MRTRILITDAKTAEQAKLACTNAVRGAPKQVLDYWHGQCVPGTTVIIDGPQIHNVAFARTVKAQAPA